MLLLRILTLRRSIEIEVDSNHYHGNHKQVMFVSNIIIKFDTLIFINVQDLLTTNVRKSITGAFYRNRTD